MSEMLKIPVQVLNDLKSNFPSSSYLTIETYIRVRQRHLVLRNNEVYIEDFPAKLDPLIVIENFLPKEVGNTAEMLEQMESKIREVLSNFSSNFNSVGKRHPD